MLNAYELSRAMQNENIILAFSGSITEELLSSVFQQMDAKMDINGAELRLRKKVNNILVECLQNVYHHTAIPDSTGINDDSASAIFMLCKNPDYGYRIITGNPMPTENVSSLKERIEYINALTKEELKVHYQESLKNSRLSEKGGAGLGIIDLVRKSGNKIQYSFDKINNATSFFTLIIEVE